MDDLHRPSPAMDREIAVIFERASELHQRADMEAARGEYRAVLRLWPQHPGALQRLGLISLQTNDPLGAIELFGLALLIQPDDAPVHILRGSAYSMLGQHEAAIACYDRAIELDPDSNASPFYNRGTALQHMKRYEAAIASYEQALEIESDLDADAHYGRAAALLELKRYTAALDGFEQAIALGSSCLAGAHYGRGIALTALGQRDAALASFDCAVEIKPEYAAAWSERGNLLAAAKRWDAALLSYDQAAALEPGIKGLPGQRCLAKLHLCDWRGLDAQVTGVCAAIERGVLACAPFAMLALTDSAGLQLRAAQIFVQTEFPPDSALPPVHRRPRHSRIRVGYFSAHFHDHAVSFLSAELYETHDRSRFDVTAFSYGPDADGGMRNRLRKAFDRFIDVREYSDRDIAVLARGMELDIAVDLGGFTEDCRPGIMALRAAPLQVGYLGYLGTMAAPYIDYLIADAILVPPASRSHYAEKLLYLPSYQVNDTKRPIANRTFSREHLGLPPRGFVFCCLNACYKITPANFSSWMSILSRVPGSVLMLLGGSETVENNLRMEARRRKVDPVRLVFCGMLAPPDYLARYRAMDLFLDTLPYNAGTTASDALWAGLPVLTCPGRSFASRVAASLLIAIGLPELVASSREHYEDLAVELATQPQRLSAVRQRLAANRLTTPLFDIERFTWHLEAAYGRIYDRHHEALPPDDVQAWPADAVSHQGPASSLGQF